MKQEYNRQFKAALRISVEQSVLTDYYLESIIISEDVYNEIDNRGFIVEAKSTSGDISGTKYSYRIDRPFGEQKPGNLKHIHIFVNGNELFAMNVDGTAHDGCHKVKIPQVVNDFMVKKGFKVPTDGIIEFYNAGSSHLLLESANDILLPTELCELAMFFGEIIRNSGEFQLIESNMPSVDVRMMAISKYDFAEVLSLPIRIDQRHYHEFKHFLIHALDDHNNFNPFVVSFNGSLSNEFALYVGRK